ncbi:coiled-coil domain containing 18 [Chelydra serpentina]|uniref:Coiled-coil domain containing 18 n=1 Tax=Chelydra serpentina TaxID=8475 RepID=A0A8T1T194_CHESE|nr:coiled-coil domain containing 18 [Chelydra serpentina]
MFHFPVRLLTFEESEVTRLQTRIAGHERTEGIKKLPIPLVLSDHTFFDVQEQDSFKHSHTSYFKHRKLRRSISASDLGVKDDDSLDLSKTMLKDFKQMLTLQPSMIPESPKDFLHTPPNSLNESSFDPLTYTVDEDVTSDSNDFQTLSGMLKYINKEMRQSENASVHISCGTNSKENQECGLWYSNS